MTTAIKRNNRNTENKRKPRTSRVKLYSLMMLSGIIVVSGFFFAAQQHFSSIDFGIRNSKLRRQVDELEKEKRRLLVARETSLAPAEIRKSAKKLGMSGSEDVTLASASVTPTKATAASFAKANGKAVSTEPAAAYVVTKTAFTRPSADSAPKAEQIAKKSAAESGERRRIVAAE